MENKSPVCGWIRDLFEGLLSLIYPLQCPLCRTILPADHPAGFCPLCLTELPGDPQDALGGPFSILSATPYTGTAQRLVQRLKYESQPWVGRSMGRLMARRWEAREPSWEPDAVVPVPLHPARRRQRGYNQSEILARELAWQLDTPFRNDLLRRTRFTPPQVGLSREKRLKNLKGAFSASQKSAGLRLLIVDDVTTTGATFSSCFAALAERKAEDFRGYAWAQGILKTHVSS